MPHLDLESSARCDRLHPALLFQQTETDNRSFVQAVGGNVDAVTDTGRSREANRTRFRRHAPENSTFAVYSSNESTLCFTRATNRIKLHQRNAVSKYELAL